MRKLLLSTIGLAALAATPALSADMPVKYKAPPVALWSWTGCYIGGNVGAGWRHTEWTSTVPGATTSVTQEGPTQVVGGAQAGCNYQFSNWLIGFELGATAARFDSFNTVLEGGFFHDFHSTANGIYDAAIRLGWAQDRWLAYVKGGYAHTTLDFGKFRTFDGLAREFASVRADGFVAGVGLEYALTDHLVGGIEYDFYGFRPSDQLNVIAPPTLPASITGIRHDVQTVTLRLSYFWNAWGGPAVVAKY